MKRLALVLCTLVLTGPLIGCGGGVVEGMPANPQPPGPPPNMKDQMDSFRKGAKAKPGHTPHHSNN